MTRDPLEVLRAVLNESLINEDGEAVVLTLQPPLTDAEIDQLRSRLPMPLPRHIERLLRFCRGIDGTSAAEELDFSGNIAFEFADAFPHGLPIASDGWGNFWLADLQPSSDDFGPIYFACHDPPIALFQSATLADFLDEVFKMDKPPNGSVVDDVHEDRLYKVWTQQPGVIPHEEALRSPDEALRTFAADLSHSYVLVDLRQAKPGQGFAWGRYRDSVRRFGEQPIFALEKKSGPFARLLKRVGMA